jgi:hypothetical protein
MPFFYEKRFASYSASLLCVPFVLFASTVIDDSDIQSCRVGL